MKIAYATLFLIFAYLAAMSTVEHKTASRHDHNHQLEKAKGEFLIEISSNINHSAAPNEEFELTAHISPLGVASQAEYKWSLPKNLEILSGSSNGVVSINQENESVVKILVKQINKENAQIHLEVVTHVEGIKLGSVAQFNSVYQPAIDKHLESHKKEVQFLNEQGFSQKVIQ